MSRHLRAATRASHSVLLALPVLSVVVVLALLLWPGSGAGRVATFLHAATLLVAIGSLLRGPRLGRSLRASRRLLAGALAAAGTGLVVSQVLARADGTVPVPSLADGFSLLWVPLAVAAFWRVPRSLSPFAGGRMLADAALAATALLFAAWLLVLEPVLTQAGVSLWAAGVEALYPMLDVFVATLVMTLLAFAETDVRRFLDAVVAGLLLVAVADIGSTLSLVRDGAAAFGWQDVPLQAGLALLATAPWRSLEQRAERPWRRLVETNLSQLTVLVAGAVGLWHVLVGRHPLDAEDCVLGALMLAAGVTRQLLHSAELNRLLAEQIDAAGRDALTGLASRSAMTQALDAAEDGGALLIVDIDGLDEVNKSLGLRSGDAVLQGVATDLLALPGVQLVARTGSDEFALLVPPVGPAPEDLAHRIAGRRTVTCEAGRVDVVCTVGWADALPGDRPHDLLGRAGLALEAAKSEPERLHGYTAAVGASAQRRRRVIAALGGAVERGELSVHYQPVHDLRTGELTAVEALLRWRHDLLGSVSPNEFIPLAEDTGQILPMGEWILDRVLHQLESWDRAGVPVPAVFVNLSARQVTDGLPERVLDGLRDHGLAPRRLVVELTENCLSDDAVHRGLQRLRAAGVRVAVDDFGAGYSSLSRLAGLPADILKLDRDFVLNAALPGGRAVLAAAVDLAKALRLVTVVEGVETEEQLAAAAASGADLVQGFLLSHPAPADSLHVVPRLPLPRSARARLAR